MPSPFGNWQDVVAAVFVAVFCGAVGIAIVVVVVGMTTSSLKTWKSVIKHASIIW